MSATKFHTHTKQQAELIVVQYVSINKYLDSNLENKLFFFTTQFIQHFNTIPSPNSF